jgi:hypothetical protein
MRSRARGSSLTSCWVDSARRHQRWPRRARCAATVYARCTGCHALACDRVGPRHCRLFGRHAALSRLAQRPRQHPDHHFDDAPSHARRSRITSDGLTRLVRATGWLCCKASNTAPASTTRGEPAMRRQSPDRHLNASSRPSTIGSPKRTQRCRPVHNALTSSTSPLLPLIQHDFLRPCHSHSIINRSRKPAWLKGFAMIDMGHYRRFYRHPTRALVWCGRWRDLRGDNSGNSIVNRPLG